MIARNMTEKEYRELQKEPVVIPANMTQLQSIIALKSFKSNKKHATKLENRYKRKLKQKQKLHTRRKNG